MESSAVPGGWKHLAFSGTKPHTISETAGGGLKISVNQSAGPLIYQFQSEKQITGLRFTGATNGAISVAKGQQGEPGNDDFVLRLGIITVGKQKLNRLQKALAPAWIRELSQLSPDRKSLGKILFFNVENSSGTNWRARVHPQSKGLVHEKIIYTLDESGQINFEVELEQKQKVIGLWIACDGDDTGARFDVTIDQIQICEG